MIGENGEKSPGLCKPLFSFHFACLFLPAATKLGQGNIFTSVCQEFCPQGGGGRVSASVHAGIPPPDQAPPRDQAHPPGPGIPLSRPPGTRHPPPETRHTPPSRHPPGTRHTPPGDQAHPPGKQTAAYGQRAAGTHPTGMHSC